MREPQAGGIVLGWLLRLVITMAVLSLLLFEVGAVVLASVRADDAAAEVARAAVVAYGSSGSVEQAAMTATEAAEDRDVDLTTFEQDGTTLVIEVSTQAETVALHRLPGTEGLITRTASRRPDVGG
ncbi:MAG: hypothetical protein ACLFUG_03995 [Nitriliruptoraceae bacterium]